MFLGFAATCSKTKDRSPGQTFLSYFALLLFSHHDFLIRTISEHLPDVKLFCEKNVLSLKCWFYFTKSYIYMYTCICIYIFFQTFQSISHLKSLPLNPGSLFKKQPQQPKLPSLCLNICFRIQNNCLVEFELLIQTLLKYIHFKNTDDTATFSL